MRLCKESEHQLLVDVSVELFNLLVLLDRNRNPIRKIESTELCVIDYLPSTIELVNHDHPVEPVVMTLYEGSLAVLMPPYGKAIVV
ncbi:MAG TPA: hypothetical protein VD928_00645 [Candidatus Paceibacterota bacterium]|nr:hypothetical protein [Candidatus Paceibacterota bacterium]